MKTFFAFCLTISAAALCSGLVSGCKNTSSDPRAEEKYAIHHFEDNPYLAEVWWGEDYDQDIAIKHMCDKYNKPGEGGCSSWRRAGLHGRNIDWMMREYASLIIHMPKTDKVKYASVSIVAGVPAVNKAFIDDNGEIPESLRTWLPAAVVDGINECGVAINHNIVPYDGKPYVADGDLVTTMVVRYVLDNCASVQEAIELLKTRKVTQAVVAIAGDYSHFFISDPTESAVIEWIDGEMRATRFADDGKGNFFSPAGQPAIMTNYFVAEAEKYGFKTNEFFKNHPKGCGIERAETIARQLPAAETPEDHLAICKSVWYSRYCKGESDWYTENAGSYGYDEAAGKAYWIPSGETEPRMMDNDDIYAAAKALSDSGCMEGYYNDFKTKFSTISPDNTYWFTQHSVVYDVNAKKGYVIMQEGMFSDKVIEINI